MITSGLLKNKHNPASTNKSLTSLAFVKESPNFETLKYQSETSIQGGVSTTPSGRDLQPRQVRFNISAPRQSQQLKAQDQEEAFRRLIEEFSSLDKLEHEKQVQKATRTVENNMIRLSQRKTSIRVRNSMSSSPPSIVWQQQASHLENSAKDVVIQSIQSFGGLAPEVLKRQTAVNATLKSVKMYIDLLRDQLSQTRALVIHKDQALKKIVQKAFSETTRYFAPMLRNLQKRHSRSSSVAVQTRSQKDRLETKVRYAVSTQTQQSQLSQDVHKICSEEKKRLQAELRELLQKHQAQQAAYLLEINQLKEAQSVQKYAITFLKEQEKKSLELKEEAHMKELERVYQNHREQIKDLSTSNTDALKQKEEMIADLRLELRSHAERIQQLDRQLHRAMRQIQIRNFEQSQSILNAQRMNNEYPKQQQLIESERRQTIQSAVQKVKGNPPWIDEHASMDGRMHSSKGYPKRSDFIVRTDSKSMYQTSTQNRDSNERQNSEKEKLQKVLEQKDLKINFLEKILKNRKYQTEACKTEESEGIRGTLEEQEAEKQSTVIEQDDKAGQFYKQTHLTFQPYNNSKIQSDQKKYSSFYKSRNSFHEHSSFHRINGIKQPLETSFHNESMILRTMPQNYQEVSRQFAEGRSFVRRENVGKPKTAMTLTRELSFGSGTLHSQSEPTWTPKNGFFIKGTQPVVPQHKTSSFQQINYPITDDRVLMSKKVNNSVAYETSRLADSSQSHKGFYPYRQQSNTSISQLSSKINHLSRELKKQLNSSCRRVV